MLLKFFSKKQKKSEIFRSNRGHHGMEIDPDMNYCPSCRDEYRPDAARCGICNKALVSGKEKIARLKLENEQFAGRSMEIQPDDELITIQRGSIKDIKVLRNLLAGQRIPALIAGDSKDCRKGCCGPEMYLQIRKQDLTEAAEIITKDFVKATALETHHIEGGSAVFDHLAKETVCPACGCRFSPTVGACPDCGLSFG